MPAPEPKPYHHRRLREAVIEAALDEITAVGPARLSMREIARRAGVSHAAPAHHFGDKRGIFTAIATEGFVLMREQAEPWVTRPNALLNAGLSYVGFAATHPAHFEVMWRPDLYDSENPAMQSARERAFDILYRSVEQGLGGGDPDQVLGTSIAAWSVVHGFAALLLSGNLPPELTGDFDAMATLVTGGIAAMGHIVQAQSAGGLVPMASFGLPRRG